MNYKKKLRKLREFNQKSPEIFKEVEEFLKKLSNKDLPKRKIFGTFQQNQFNIPSGNKNLIGHKSKS